jgi:hypothetical protein
VSTWSPAEALHRRAMGYFSEAYAIRLIRENGKYDFIDTGWNKFYTVFVASGKICIENSGFPPNNGIWGQIQVVSSGEKVNYD